MLWAEEEEVAGVLEGAGPHSTRVMVPLGTFLFTAFDSGSKVLTKCTSLQGQEGKTFLYETWQRNTQTWG